MNEATSQSRPDPVGSMITANVVAVLKGIRTVAGYQTTLTVEEDDDAGGNTPAHFKAVVFEGDDTELGDDETPLGMKAWLRPYAVMVYVFASELASDDAFRRARARVRADVERAVMLDHTRGGWAQNTEVRSPQAFGGPSDPSGVLVFFDVTYRTDERDPYKRVPDGNP